jgi:hypothetical protein
MRLIFTILIFCVIYTSCTYETIEREVPGKYFFNPNNTTVQWTAYKFTSKFGVSGTIDGFKYIGDKNFITKSDEIKNILRNMKFEVEPNLMSQESTLKNDNIQHHFFDKLASKRIFGQIINIDLNKVEGTATIELNFNNVSKVLNANYTIADNKIELKTTINLGDFSALSALDSLSKQCYELHKGSDNISMTWPDVDIKVVSILDKANDK